MKKSREQTEVTWLASKKPSVLMAVVRVYFGRGRWRRCLLFNCACCRRIWHLLRDGSRKFIETVERHADAVKQPPRSEFWEWEKKAHQEPFTGPWLHPDTRACIAAAEAAYSVKQENNRSAEKAAMAVARLAPRAGDPTAKAAEQAEQCRILRDIFGNPFRPATRSTAWLNWNDGIIVRLAQAAYDERILPVGTLDNARLAILADALEEAGCTEERILMHLRDGGEHYRGCWVVDLLLGKC